MRILEYRSSAPLRSSRRRIQWRIAMHVLEIIVCLAVVVFFGYWVFLAGFKWMVYGERMAAPACLGSILVCAVFLVRSIVDGYKVVEARRRLRELR